MLELPEMYGMPLVRTHFGDASTWQQFVDIVTNPIEIPEFDMTAQGNISVVDDIDFRNLSVESLLKIAGSNKGVSNRCLFVYDDVTETGSGFPVLAIDLDDLELGDQFRLAATEIHLIENNLQTRNMDFREYRQAASVERSGVFRGFGG